MPIYKKIQHNTHTQILVWEIVESKSKLMQGLDLTESSTKRIEGMRSELHQKGFLSIRQLLRQVGYTDRDLFYTDDGKPHLKDGKHISISHSFIFATIAISKYEIGIDIEKNREAFDPNEIIAGGDTVGLVFLVFAIIALVMYASGIYIFSKKDLHI